MKTLNKLKIFMIAFIAIISMSNANAQCTASFNVVDNGNGNYTFTSTSTGVNGNTSYQWYADNSYLGGVNSITNTFVNGTYNVCLLIEDSAAGCFDNACQTVTVTSGANPTCNASFSTSIGANGYALFSNLSSNYDYATWNYGDGSNGVDDFHTYSSNGTYNVCLTVGDSSGMCTDTYCDSIIITNANSGTPCNLTAGISYVDNGSGNYTFTSTSVGNVVVDYWSFGDGGTGIGASVNHTFAANGTYVVSLFSSDSASSFTCNDYTTVTIVVTGVVNSVSCQAGFVMYTDSLNTGTVFVVNSSTGNNLTYFWNFGDGNTSNQQYPNYTYTTAGPFNLCLTVSDSNGSCTSTYCDSIGSNGVVLKQSGFTINVQAPVVTGIKTQVETVSDINLYPNPVKENLTINLGLNEASSVEVFVADMLGNKVSVIANQQMHSGTNQLQWRTNDVPNGIYLLNIRTENSLEVKKLIVNR